MPIAEQDRKRALGLGADPSDERTRSHLIRYINLRLLAAGLSSGAVDEDADFNEVAHGMAENLQEKNRLLADHRCPVDQRIEDWLQQHFADLGDEGHLRLPSQTFELDRHGVARELSLPVGADSFKNELIESYRVANGVLHNPRNDRRTTKGTFHVVEGGLPVPADKKAVPRVTFARLFKAAVQLPQAYGTLPFTSDMETPAQSFVSLLLRPVVCPEVPGISPEKSMEVRFYVPGSMVSNLDFVESIFGNAGHPVLPENDAALDVQHWTGHTGCVILAPQLSQLTKKELGLPHVDDATDRQKRDGMCWASEDEVYNDGTPFKLTCRTAEGVIVTLIADNYFGYCKKEVKTQLSYATNLHGQTEEEHAGGALAFAGYNLGESFQARSYAVNQRTFDEVVRDCGPWLDVQPEGYAVDTRWPDLVYVPGDSFFSVADQSASWERDGVAQSLQLQPGKVYMTPSGYKVRLQKHPAAPSWRLVGSVGEGTFCHKPCTVSGGGKSEISKSLSDYMLYGPIFTADIERDLDQVQALIERDYADRWHPENRPAHYADRPSRPVLSPKRSLGSVIKLLNPSTEYNDAYNAWLAGIDNYILSMVFVVKRLYRPEWGDNWREYFGADLINGFPGHELKHNGRKVVGSYLRVGFHGDQQWRTFKLRQDFMPADKVQTEDDISTSVVVPVGQLDNLPDLGSARTSAKLLTNCEYRLFQRPDEAIHRGFDRQAELDMSRHGSFLSNYQPMPMADIRTMADEVVTFDAFSVPMQRFLREASGSDQAYAVCSANPRIVDGKPTKNPRYLQDRPDLQTPFESYVARMGMRLARGARADQAVPEPVSAVLLGRRNNPAEHAAGIRGLAVYNPLHYQDLPELFMDFVCSLTGKSPSTTGAGSEGALTKGPFNALLPVTDLNNALVSFILTGHGGFSSSAGYVGPNVRVDHDLSLLVPEIWSRMSPLEREPQHMIERGLLERLEDFEHNGEQIAASRLGWRITQDFVRTYFGRVFDNPAKVFDATLLKPETQGLEDFVDGIKNITEAHQRVAKFYFEDGSVELACPPLKALLTIMAEGNWQGKDVHDPDVRAMFTLEALLKSDWYRARLEARRDHEIALWQRHLASLDAFMARDSHVGETERLNLAERRAWVEAQLAVSSAPGRVDELVGTLGLDPAVALG